jgi:hypothetical protein
MIEVVIVCEVAAIVAAILRITMIVGGAVACLVVGPMVVGAVIIRMMVVCAMFICTAIFFRPAILRAMLLWTTFLHPRLACLEMLRMEITHAATEVATAAEMPATEAAAKVATAEPAAGLRRGHGAKRTHRNRCGQYESRAANHEFPPEA